MSNKSTFDIPPRDCRPVVVLVGAGASKAACPLGDRNGKVVPVMAEIAEAVGLEPLIRQTNFTLDGANFEEFYGALAADKSNAGLVEEIEQKVLEYFTALELPARPTVYDHLVVALRPKDCIVTFNWDPLIAQAIQRTAARAQGPRIVCLHGNVSLGYCTAHAPIVIGHRGRCCGRCGNEFGPARLLFPTREKDYSDPVLRVLWDVAQAELREAGLLTFFGYSAPTSDRAAIELLRSAWSDSTSRELGDTDIIDIKAQAPTTRRELESQWKPFVHNQYAEFRPDFWTSRIACSPRRTYEVMIASQLDMEFLEERPPRSDGGWDDFWDFYGPLLANERDGQPA